MSRFSKNVQDFQFSELSEDFHNFQDFQFSQLSQDFQNFKNFQDLQEMFKIFNFFKSLENPDSL